MVKGNTAMYNATFLGLIILFAILSGMIGQQAMAILHAPNTMEGLTLKSVSDGITATKNKLKRQATAKVASVTGGAESFTTRQMGNILDLAGIGGGRKRSSTTDDSD
jgi:hypothetical protein